MRAVVQGLDLRDSWDRYLRLEGDGRDLRRINATVTWIRDCFAAAARREARHGTARLVRIDVRQLVQTGRREPSLEDFAVEHGLEGFSEADQLAAFEQAFGKAEARLKRSQRLIARQLEALRWLEGLVVRPPSLDDDVQAWLHPDLARLLAAAGLVTLAQLAGCVNGRGQHWYRGIRSVGPIKAQRIMGWLRQHEQALGVQVGAHAAWSRGRIPEQALGAVVAPATEIRPLEKFVVPESLDGRCGKYRCPQSQCLLAAENDYQAILAWLHAKSDVAAASPAREGLQPAPNDDGVRRLSNTQRAYRKEAERLLLWAVIERGCALSSMSQEDGVAYLDFLANPQPSDQWCGPRSSERWSPLWRPFEGPLSTQARRQAITILKSFYSFLIAKGYTSFSPWVGIELPAAPARRPLNPERSLTLQQWQVVQELLQRLPDTSANRRLGLAMKWVFATGLRAAELCSARLDDLRLAQQPGDAVGAPSGGAWVLSVATHEQRGRTVPVPGTLIEELGHYLISRGLPKDPLAPENRGVYLLGKAVDAGQMAPGLYKSGLAATPLDPRAGVATTTLYRQMVSCFERCARVLALQGDVAGARQLAQASTHWLRHSYAHQAMAEGVPLRVVQHNLGHASPTTTSVYLSPRGEGPQQERAKPRRSTLKATSEPPVKDAVSRPCPTVP